MVSYLQMGHDTENLIGEKDLEEYRGIVLSPVNRSRKQLLEKIPAIRATSDLKILLDPQLYVPRSNRDKLLEQPYFPDDIDTADLSSEEWWKAIIKKLYEYAIELGVEGLIAPACLPKIWGSEYYSQCASVFNLLLQRKMGSGNNLTLFFPLIVRMSELSIQDRVMELASVSTGTDCDGVYLILESDLDPRREFSDEKEIFGTMSLIREIRDGGKAVFISNCSSDMILYRCAGAKFCATSKFFNLRRFTKSRFEPPPATGGGQMPYWFEHGLMAFLREADVARIREDESLEIIGTMNSSNWWGDKILDVLEGGSGDAWLGYSWRQYLSWFCKTEPSLAKKSAADTVDEWLLSAEQNWKKLQDAQILMDEERNDGSWIRPWRQALARFNKKYPSA